MTSRVRCAVRYASLVGCSIYEAAQAFELNAGAVHNAWGRIYPTRPHPVSANRREPTCLACGRRGHLAVGGACSRSYRALQLIDGGSSVSEAAAELGISANTIREALLRRRVAA